ncbi:tripartite-type tricarboxylate transporter receptor subunit TctC [Acidovorax soli]|uniref:Tripartite-type tricarboxylate transporter receptor subunit TctC n=1 Tax=Acidovorax soli TaxID=592050 RepID=A0A7X0UC57_9BURK|nr:tripartite tricarboxylate transporter substrate binding protein [Acidovorax soli]MBB6562679.1 tripartite-type tricarboxylate transporter receptor subunit TctC [Acidovorax soli]
MDMQAPFLRTNRRAALAAIAAFGASPLIGAHAQERKYPSKPVTIVVPYSAGGGTDIVGRLMAQRLSEVWGQSVIVDNRTGANGVIGSSYVAKAAPDGHTLLLVVGSHAINPVLMKSLPYDTAKAFTPVTNIANSPMVLVVAADGPYKQLPDLLKVAREKEVAVGYSEGQTRLTGELIRQSGNLQITGVPYKGGAPIMVDIIGGHLPAGVTSVLTALPHIHSGKLRVVGVAAEQRMGIFPEAMTFKEAGLAGVQSLNWYGMFGPAGLPDTVVERINQDLRKVAADPAVTKQMQDQGASIVLTPPAEFRRFVEGETRKWAQVAQRGGISAE